MSDNLTNPSYHDLDLIRLQNDFFKQLKAKGRSHNTLKNYKTDLDCFNNYLQTNKKALDITEFRIPHVEQYGRYLENRYKSDNSRRRRVQALRIFFDYLVQEKIFKENPVRKLPTSPKFLDIPRPTPFADVKTLWQYLLEEAQSKNAMNALLAYRNSVTLLLIYGAGLKVSDISGLKRSHIHLDGENPRVMVIPPKRDPYTIPLPPVFTPVFQEYLKRLEKMMDENMKFDHVLFNANPYRILSGGLSPRGLEIIFEEFRKKLMINLTPKSLRQACVFKWIRQQNKETTIKEWLGVAPSYNLKVYKDHLDSHVYDDNFLKELYLHYSKKNYARS